MFLGDEEIRRPQDKLQHDDEGKPLKQNTAVNNAAKLLGSTEVSAQLHEELSSQAKKAFLAMGGRHYCVFDFRVMQTGSMEKAYFLEACSSAGFSPTSIIVRMADK